jgi:hypothetical protein
MRRPLALAVATFFLSIGVFVLGMTLIVDSTDDVVSFPASIPLTTPAASPRAAPVSYPAPVVGRTKLASVGRGGQAVPTLP